MPKTITPDYALIPAADARSHPYGWGTLTFLADAEGGTSPHVSMAHVTIRAGTRNMRHCHPNCDELLYLLAGHLRHAAGEAWVDMAPGDTIRITANVPHQAEALGTEDAVMLVVYSAGDRETDVLDEVKQRLTSGRDVKRC